MVCIDGGAGDLKAYFGPSWEMAEQTMRPPALSGITPAMLRAWMNSSPLRDGSDPDTAAAILGGNFEDDGTGAGTLRPRLSLEHHMEIAHHLFDANGYELMAKVRCPMLFIPAGHPDHEDSPKVRSIARAREVVGDRAHFVWIDGVHDLPVQRPVEVAVAIAAFVDELAATEQHVPEVALAPGHALVDVDVLHLGVLEQSLAAVLATDAALLVAAERRQRIEQVPVVDPDGPGAQLLGDLDGAARVPRPHPAREAVDRPVGALDHLAEVAPALHREHRSEDLLGAGVRIGRHIGEHGRLDEEAAITDVGRASAAARDRRALLLRPLDRGQDHVVLRLADHRADLGVEVGRVTDSQRRRTVDEAVDERVVDVVVDEEARARFAHLALVEEGAEERAVDRDVEVRVGADDVRRLAAELERHLLDGGCGGGEDLAAGGGGPGEGDLVDVGVLDELDARRRRCHR